MEKKEKNKRSKLNKKRRNNAILYPIYKMFSWDLLCYYSIEFLFYTITKNITASQVLIITAIYIVGKMLFQIPSVALSDYLGKRTSMIIGNGILVLFMIILIYSPNIWWIMLATALSGFGYDIKAITEGNLLYDSVATRGGDGIYTKIDSKGASAYYIIDTILSVIAGYMFIINNYLPIYICLTFLIISFILSFKFEDIHRGKKEKTGIDFKNFIQGYSKDIKDAFSFIKRSNRMKSYVIFAAVFYGIIKIMTTYRNDLLTDLQIGEAQFSLIYAILSLIAAISSMFSRQVQKKFKNKTLKFISLSYILSIIGIGLISIKFTNDIAIPFVLILCSIMRMADSQWYVTEYTYLRNFTTYETRTKITFTFELIVGGIASCMSILGAILLKYLNIRYSIILLGLLSLALMTVILDYMKTRFGLKPREYKKEDIKFILNKEKSMCIYRKENLEAINYTKAHRKAFKEVEKELLGHNTWRSLVHDLDKVILHNFLKHSTVKKIHVKTARHHDNKIKKNRNDYIEMIVDWECARRTKPDKPLNAYDTLYKFYPNLESEILPILKEFHLDHHTEK